MLCIAIVCGGCERNPTDVDDGGIRTEVFVSQTDLTLPGDSLVVRVVATNTTRWPRTIVIMPICNSNFRLYGPSGEQVFHDPDGCLLRRETTLIARGAHLEVTRIWRGQVRSGVRGFAPPGTYQLHGVVPGSGLVSTPVTLRVRAAE